MASYAGRKITTSGGRGISAEIRIEGMQQTMTALKMIEPEVYSRLRKNIKDTVAGLGRAATFTRESEQIGSGVGAMYKTSLNLLAKKPSASVTALAGPRTSANDWSSPATRAVIFEFAQNSARPQMRAAIESFQARYGAPGRILWGAWDGMADEVQATIERDIHAATEKVEAYMYQGV